MKESIKILLIAVVMSVLLTGCSLPDDSDTIPTISTQSMRDELILRELKQQTELMSQIKDKLYNQ